jgi:NTP pyrophosphatase (non-canonical NTP hydrolase)
MINHELLQFIEDQLKLLEQRDGMTAAVDLERSVYAKTIKLGEEVGELNEAVLAKFKKQRSSKQKDFSIEAELADVIIVALIIAQKLDIDINEALRSKVETIIARRTH